MRGGGGDDDLWAKAAELERQFEGYKRRVAERRSSSAAAADRHDGDGDGGAVEVVAVGKGRRYDAYVRRRDEKLRQGWRARMERKEAEMKALWARLDVDRRRDGDLAAGNGKQVIITLAYVLFFPPFVCIDIFVGPFQLQKNSDAYLHIQILNVVKILRKLFSS